VAPRNGASDYASNEARVSGAEFSLARGPNGYGCSLEDATADTVSSISRPLPRSA